MAEKEKYSILELAKMLDISTSAIRFYEDKGLILPKRSKGNQRYYTGRDKTRLKLILRGKRFGVSLDEISEMIGMAEIEFNEKDQITKSLFYIEKKFEEIRVKKSEIEEIENELKALKRKLLKREKEL